MEVMKKRLAALDHGEGIIQVGTSDPEGLHLSPLKYHPCFKLFLDEIIVESLLVVADKLLTHNIMITGDVRYGKGKGTLRYRRYGCSGNKYLFNPALINHPRYDGIRPIGTCTFHHQKIGSFPFFKRAGITLQVKCPGGAQGCHFQGFGVAEYAGEPLKKEAHLVPH